MAEETPRLKIAYPSQHQQPFFDTFETGLLAMDALHFGSIEEHNVTPYGGGNVAWTGPSGSPANEFSFDADIIFASPTFGQLHVWSAGESPIEIPPGNFLVASLTRGPTKGVTLTKSGGSPSVIVTPSVPISSLSHVIAYHDPNNGELIFTTRLSLPEGTGSGNGILPMSVGAPVDADYVTMSLNPALSNERQLVAASGQLTRTDGGPNGSVTIGLENTGVTPGAYANATVTVDQKGRVTNIVAGSGGTSCLAIFAVGPACPYQVVQDAIDAAETAGGGLVVVTEGTYDENLVITDDRVHMEGWGVDSAGAPLVTIAPTTGDALTISPTAASAVVAIGNMAFSPVAGHGIVVNGTATPHIVHLKDVTVTVSDSASDCLRLDGTGFPVVEATTTFLTVSPANATSRCVRGISTGGLSQVTLRQSRVTNTSQTSVESNNRVDLVNCVGCTGDHIVTSNGFDLVNTEFSSGDSTDLQSGVLAFIFHSEVRINGTGGQVNGCVYEPNKNGYRGGTNDGGYWNNAVYGVGSFSWGKNVRLEGENTGAFGELNTDDATSSHNLLSGISNDIVDGVGNALFGSGNDIEGNNNVVGGELIQILGGQDSNAAFGILHSISDSSVFVAGLQNTIASGGVASAMFGIGNTSEGPLQLIQGNGIEADGEGAIVFGQGLANSNGVARKFSRRHSLNLQGEEAFTAAATDDAYGRGTKVVFYAQTDSSTLTADLTADGAAASGTALPASNRFICEESTQYAIYGEVACIDDTGRRASFGFRASVYRGGVSNVQLDALTGPDGATAGVQVIYDLTAGNYGVAVTADSANNAIQMQVSQTASEGETMWTATLWVTEVHIDGTDEGGS